VSIHTDKDSDSNDAPSQRSKHAATEVEYIYKQMYQMTRQEISDAVPGCRNLRHEIALKLTKAAIKTF
jgi:hypothetical protein